MVKDNVKVLFPENDHVRSVGQENLDIALSLIKPLPAAVARLSSNGTMAPALLEAVYAQGQVVRKALASKARSIGNEFFQKLNAASGPDAHALREDVLVEYGLARQDLEQVATVCANTAAMHLKLKE